MDNRSRRGVLLTLSFALLTACGGNGADGGGESTPITTITRPAASSTPVASTSSTAEAGPVDSATAPPPLPTRSPSVQPTSLPPRPTLPPPPPQPQAFTIAGVDTTFAPSSLTAAPGPISITLDNRDAGVLHDIVIYDAAGAQVAATALVTGPSQAVTSFTASPGIFPFKCSVHPQQMTGAIRVQ